MWIERATYWIHSAEQGSQEWRQSRLGRITASDFGTILGCNRYKTPAQALDYFIGKKTVADNPAMAHGRKFEPYVRDWYIQKYGVNVSEWGLIVPKWDVHIGCSLDGEVGEDGMIEIKCPQRMYPYLRDNKKLENWAHIPATHYAQMQGCMAITGKQWCDYLVYSDSEKQMYKERIPFHQDYWNNLYSKLKEYWMKNEEEMSKVRMDPR